MVSILLALLPGGVYANSEVDAALTGHSQHHTHFPAIFSMLIPAHSLQEVTAMCTWGPSTVRVFA